MSTFHPLKLGAAKKEHLSNVWRNNIHKIDAMKRVLRSYELKKAVLEKLDAYPSVQPDLLAVLKDCEKVLLQKLGVEDWSDTPISLLDYLMKSEPLTVVRRVPEDT